MTKSVAANSRLWLLLSPSLPVGGYSYSQGLETAQTLGALPDFAAAKDWIFGVAKTALVHQDLACLTRLIAAKTAQDEAGFAHWNDVLLACRESAELTEEDTDMGAALQRLAKEIAPDLQLANSPLTFAAAFAALCVHWQISRRDALAGYAWIWFENQVAAAIKLVPLGHTNGQRILLDAAEQCEQLIEQAEALDDDDIGYALPGLGIMSARHESSEFRLFRS